VKPQLQTMIEAEIEKNPYEVISCRKLWGSFFHIIGAFSFPLLRHFQSKLIGDFARDLQVLLKELFERLMLVPRLAVLMAYLAKILVQN